MFTYHKICPFEVCNAVIIRIFIELQSSSLFNFRIFLSSPKESLILISHLLSTTSLKPWQEIIFLFLWICLFCVCHMNGNMHYVAFCDWILWLSIFFFQYCYMLFYVSILHFFLLPDNILFIDIPYFFNSPVSKLLSCFYLLLLVINYAAMNSYVRILWGKLPSCFQNGYIVLPSYRKVWVFRLLYILE